MSPGGDRVRDARTPRVSAPVALGRHAVTSSAARSSLRSGQGATSTDDRFGPSARRAARDRIGDAGVVRRRQRRRLHRHERHRQLGVRRRYAYGDVWIARPSAFAPSLCHGCSRPAPPDPDECNGDRRSRGSARSSARRTIAIAQQERSAPRPDEAATRPAVLSTSDSSWALVGTLPAIEMPCIPAVSRGRRGADAAEKTRESVLTMELLWDFHSRARVGHHPGAQVHCDPG